MPWGISSTLLIGRNALWLLWFYRNCILFTSIECLFIAHIVFKLRGEFYFCLFINCSLMNRHFPFSIEQNRQTDRHIPFNWLKNFEWKMIKQYLPVEALVSFPLPLLGSKLEHFNSIVYCRWISVNVLFLWWFSLLPDQLPDSLNFNQRSFQSYVPIVSHSRLLIT